MQKADNDIEIVEVKKPANLGNDAKSHIKALYTRSEGGKNKLPLVTREQSVYAFLEKMANTINEMTSITPKYDNEIAFDTSKPVDQNTELNPCRCDRSELIVVISE